MKMKRRKRRVTHPRYFNDERGDSRLKPQEFRKTWKVAQIWDLHYEIARRIALGEKSVDIAEALGVSAQTVSNVKRSPAIEKHVEVLRGAMDADTIDLGRRIQEIAPLALDLLEDVIKGNGDGQNASIGQRIKVADKHLDRAGYSPVRKFEGAMAHLTAEDIENIKERARNAGLVKRVVEEVTEDAETVK
jgi:hypothetical protein